MAVEVLQRAVKRRPDRQARYRRHSKCDAPPCENKSMRYRLLAAAFVVCTAAMGQSMSVAQLRTFLKSCESLIQKGTMTDKEVADHLTKVKLTERLDDRTIEELQGNSRLGPRTMGVLRALRDRSQALSAAAPVVTPPATEFAPPPSSEEQAKVLQEVRAYALSYSKRLPDFICTQVTRRYAAPVGRYGGQSGREPNWQILDTLQIRLSYFEQKEDYKLTLINNTLTIQDYRTVGGASSTGDFGTMMRQIFEPSTEARFEWDHWGTLRGRLTMVFGYHVTQAKSQWHIVYEHSLDIVPAYRGLVYVDNETHEITRLTLTPEHLPPDFPVKSAETKLDYGYEDISGRKFLLPLKAQMQMSGSDHMTRNDTEFRMYRKYSAESDIKFDTEPIAPLPEDKTKEIKDPKVIKH